MHSLHNLLGFDAFWCLGTETSEVPVACMKYDLVLKKLCLSQVQIGLAVHVILTSGLTMQLARSEQYLLTHL